MSANAKQREEKELVCMFKHQQRVSRKVDSLEQRVDWLIAEANTGRYSRLWIKFRIKQVRRRIKRTRWHQIKNSDRIGRFARSHPDYMNQCGWEQLSSMISDNPLQ